MPKTLQEQARVGIVALLVALAMGQNAASAASPKSVFLGRWTVSDLKDKFSANGKLYRTLDFVACGKEFCGISVDGGICGVTLFRIPFPDGEGGFGGRAKWGSGTKEFIAQAMGDVSDNILIIELGDKDSHLGSRNSLPTYVGDYRKIGKAACAADTPSA